MGSEANNSYLLYLFCSIIRSNDHSATYDHRVWRTGLPVRSAVLKPHAGKLVVRWVTTSESLLLYVVFLLGALSFWGILNGPHILLNGPRPFTLSIIRPHAVIVFPMH